MRKPSYLSSKTQPALLNGRSRACGFISSTAVGSTAARGAPSRASSARISSRFAADNSSFLFTAPISFRKVKIRPVQNRQIARYVLYIKSDPARSANVILRLMNAKPFASGTISFGLVTIPVKLYSTGESSAGIQFNMLHRKCGSRLRQQYVCPLDDEVVERENIVKGYEYSRGQYVLFTEEELKALIPEPTNAVEITEFVPLDQVDPIYYERSYYLGPDRGGDRPYRLLAEAMKRTGRAALARYVARGKDQFVLVRPFAAVPIGTAEVREPELALAIQLIEQVATAEFHPEAYEDKQRQEVRELIERKVQGQEITAAPAPAPRAQIIDLMAALKASLAAASPAEAPPAKPISLAGRKPARPSPRAALESSPAGAAAPRR